MPRRFLSSRRWDVIGGRSRWLWERLNPPQLFVASFLVLVLLGTLGLKVLPGLYTGEPLGWLDALFTATSAVCVTGLTVADTATAFTPLGQVYVLLLIQVGGLGIIAFTSLIIVALGRRLSLRQEALAGVAEAAPQIDPRRLALDVVLFTLALELAGAALLYALWVPRFGWAGAAWPAAFHAVSAFCNAGFSTFSDSLIGFRDSPATLVVVAALIVLGGLGFLSLEELYLRVRGSARRRGFRLSLHTRLVLATTAALLLAGWLAFALLEWEGTLAGLPAGERLANAFFLSVTPRTAGFNNIDYTQASEGTCFLTILLMTVGGSPGSTAGGIKTTTLALLAVLAWSRYRGDETVSVGGRSVRGEAVGRAAGLAVAALTVVTAGILVLTITERGQPGDFLRRMFEAVSAFNTVGLSMNHTGDLSSAGRCVVVLLMFLGRVGTLTFAAALAVRYPKPTGFRYAYEDVVVG